MARRLLSGKAAPRARARLRRRALLHHRDQRHLLLPAAAFELRLLGRRHSGRLRLQREGLALHHPHAASCATSSRRSRTSLPPACCSSDPSSAPSCGSSRRTSSFDPARLETFFQLLPRTTTEAAELGRRHDHRVEGRAHTETDQNRPLRHAIEIRHDSFLSEEFIRLLRRYGIALVCADTVSWPRLVDATTDFVYCRLHGSRELYASGYGRQAIATWAARVAAWATGAPPSGKRISAFSDNEARPARCLRLLRQRRQGARPRRRPQPRTASRAARLRIMFHQFPAESPGRPAKASQ